MKFKPFDEIGGQRKSGKGGQQRPWKNAETTSVGRSEAGRCTSGCKSADFDLGDKEKEQWEVSSMMRIFMWMNKLTVFITTQIQWQNQ